MVEFAFNRNAFLKTVQRSQCIAIACFAPANNIGYVAWGDALGTEASASVANTSPVLIGVTVGPLANSLISWPPAPTFACLQTARVAVCLSAPVRGDLMSVKIEASRRAIDTQYFRREAWYVYRNNFITSFQTDRQTYRHIRKQTGRRTYRQVGSD